MANEMIGKARDLAKSGNYKEAQLRMKNAWRA